MPIDDEDLPDIIPDVIPDDIIDDEDEEHWRKAQRDIRRYIKKNRVTLDKAKKLRKKKIQALKCLVNELNLLMLSEAYQSRKTYAGFIKRQDKLRQSLLNSLLSGLCVDGKIYVLRDLLRELEGDTEPTEHYIW